MMIFTFTAYNFMWLIVIHLVRDLHMYKVNMHVILKMYCDCC